MDFQFVNSTTETLGQSDDIRRKIRSHAMKDYRARQRSARQGQSTGKHDAYSGEPSKPSRLTFRFVVDPRGTPNDADEDAAIQRSKSSTPMSLSPSVWGKESPDIFQSPAQLQQMFGLCREWFQWLRPDIKADFAGKPIDQAWDISPCSMLLAANCLAAIGGLDAADRNRPSGLEVVFKGRVLHEIQIRMQSSLAATTDETMSTLLFLVSYEFYRLNPEAITHLKGLRSILRLKGQNRAGMKWGGGMVLETLDLLTALWQSTDPLMTPVEDHVESSNAPPRTSLDSKSHRAFLAREAFQDIANVLTTERAQSSHQFKQDLFLGRQGPNYSGQFLRDSKQLFDRPLRLRAKR
ncbi:hypothetical protein M409DRAFT_30478 [Zasmidium cellare ATCC 36951]|uniref:Transcription factor domain-containing protein n=1 Tax=Zasmidium cellare ATCC 36951 TaxID=1080233 RepID=A0A6A6BW88_ZASCE|nr:uncharacterized protein M409DRAFT_30478 [Zasmidium cellare ATCC 36951]KAF2159057.1 hypothetical protein M409DRAFT_30478 [Zasmidium cellare ATCC 36951]